MTVFRLYHSRVASRAISISNRVSRVVRRSFAVCGVAARYRGSVRNWVQCEGTGLMSLVPAPDMSREIRSSLGIANQRATVNRASRNNKTNSKTVGAGDAMADAVMRMREDPDHTHHADSRHTSHAARPGRHTYPKMKIDSTKRRPHQREQAIKHT